VAVRRTRGRLVAAGDAGQGLGDGQEFAALPQTSDDLHPEGQRAVGVGQGQDDDRMAGETGEQGVAHRGHGPRMARAPPQPVTHGEGALRRDALAGPTSASARRTPAQP